MALVTIGILGKYTKEEFEFALAATMNQENIEIELIIAMNELDIDIAWIIQFMWVCRTPQVKRVLIHTEKEIVSHNYFSYLKEKRTGDYLVCLRDGASFAALDAVSRCLNDKKIVVGRSVGVNSQNECVVELEALEDKLHAGSVVFPKMFMQSPQFEQMDNLEELEIAISDYQKETADKLLLRFNVEIQHETKDNASEILEQNLKEWEMQVNNGELKLNYTRHLELEGLLDELSAISTENGEELGKQIDRRIRYTIEKAAGGKWEIAAADKAFIVCLIKLLDALWKPKGAKEAAIEEIKANVSFEKKINVLFTVADVFLWNSCYKSIYDAFKKDKSRYEIDLVYLPFGHPEIYTDQELRWKKWVDSGLGVRKAAEYRLDRESPDVIFYCRPYDDWAIEGWGIADVIKINRRIIYIPYNTAIMDNTQKNNMYCLPAYAMVWKQVVYSRLHEKLINENAYNTENQLLVGHPKFDVGVKDLSGKEQEKIKEIQKMAAGRKIFLWNTSFTMESWESGTFLNYGITFLVYLCQFENVFIVWRPHPNFMEKLKQFECNGMVHVFKKAAEEAGILYFDESDSQWVSVLAADVLISDPSSLIESFVPLRRPVILTMREKEENMMEDMVYQVASFEELSERVKSLASGADEKKEMREKYIRDNYFLPENETDACVGERIVQFIEDSLVYKNLEELA